MGSCQPSASVTFAVWRQTIPTSINQSFILCTTEVGLQPWSKGRLIKDKLHYKFIEFLLFLLSLYLIKNYLQMISTIRPFISRQVEDSRLWLPIDWVSLSTTARSTYYLKETFTLLAPVSYCLSRPLMDSQYGGFETYGAYRKLFIISR